MRWLPRKADPEPVQLPPEVEITPSRWNVRFRGIKIGIVSLSASEDRFFSGTPSGFTNPGGFPTRDDAVAALIREVTSRG